MFESAKPPSSSQINRLHFSDVEAQLLLQQVLQLGQHQQALEQQATAYHQAYMSALGSAELELISLKLQQLQQWLAYISSGQLEDLERQQLVNWIIKDAQALGEHGLADMQPIRDLIYALVEQMLVVAKQDTIPSHATLSQLRKALTILLEHECDITTQELLSLIASPDTLTDWLELARQATKTGQQSTNGVSVEHWQDLAAPILRDKTMQKLYKRLAHQLHPDKEQDELRKPQKQALMQRLVRAKKHSDLSTILSLYQQHATQNVKFDVAMSQAIKQALEQQGIAYSQSYQRTLQANTAKMWAWRRFSQGDLSLTTQLQQAHVKIQHERTRLTRALAQGSKVDALKHALQQR